MHKPIGISATKRGCWLSIADTLKKTSIIERESIIENSPLYDEFKAGTPIESLDLLEYIDLGVQPLDFTDADHLRQVAKEQMNELYRKYDEMKSLDVRKQSEPQASIPAEGGISV